MLCMASAGQAMAAVGKLASGAAQAVSDCTLVG